MSTLVATVALALAPNVRAAEEPVAAKTRKAKAPAKPAEVAPGASTQIGEDPYRRSPGQVVYQVLVGEIALQRSIPDLAVSAYGDLAYRTRDPKVLERTVEVAGMTRRYDIAYEAAKLWVEVEPDSLPARQTLAAVLVMMNRTDELVPQLGFLLEHDQSNIADNLLRLNRMLSRYQDKVAVYRMLEKVVAPYTGLAEAHFALATAAFHAGDLVRALMEIRKAQELRPNWDAAVLFEAQVLARESPKAALDVLQRFVDANPDSREVRLFLARALVAEKRYAEAKKHFDRLLRDSPESPELLYPVAVLALQQDDPKTAEPLLKKLLERGEAAERSVSAFYLGQIAEDRKAYAEAAEFYRQVGPSEQYATAQVRLAQLLVRQGGSIDVARQSLQDAGRRYPAGQTQFVLAEAQLLRDAGRNDEALVLLDKVLAQQPDQADVLYDAAMLAEKLGRLDVVESNLRRVIALRPDSAHAYNALGYTFADRNINLDEARSLLVKALELAPRDPFILDSMGWVLFRRGELDAALDHLQRAYGMRRDPEIAAHLGEVLWTMGRQEEAARTWREAAKDNPDNDSLRAALKKFLP